MYISRDPFAREELHKESLGQGECDWCGLKKRVWKYSVETDSGQISEINGQFCSKICMMSYHD